MCNREPDDGLPDRDRQSTIARIEATLDWYRGPSPRVVLEHFSDLFSEVIPCGRGGMGFVYRGRCRKKGESLALKLLDPEAAMDEQASRRFLREAKALKRLSHPGIVGIRDCGQRGPFHYILMEFAEGVTLREYWPLCSRRPFSIRRCGSGRQHFGPVDVCPGWMPS